MMGAEQWEQSELLRRAAMGESGAEEELVRKNLGLVHSAVKKFAFSRCDSEDLFQIGCMGLLKAIKKFDFSYGVRFSTYAVPMIIGEIKRFLRDDGPIKVSRGVKELAIKARAVSETIQKQSGEAPTVGELAAMLGKSSEEIVMALESVTPPESLYGGDDSTDIPSAIDKTPAQCENESEIVDRIALREAIGSLKARERQIIIFRYFKNKTQSEVAKELGISQVQVSRLEKKILERMREHMAV